MMRSAVYSHMKSASGGGGVSYVSSWASVLREFGPVDLYSPAAVAPGEIERMYGVPLDGVTARRLDGHRSGPAAMLARFAQGWSQRRYDFTIRQSTAIAGPTFCSNGWLLTDFPFQRSSSARERWYMSTYRGVITNSEFTARWVRRYWGAEARVFYPPVRPIEPEPKHRRITAIGRFAGGARQKFQLEMVECFRRLEAARANGWELALCGLVESQEYLDKVRRAAEGLPVTIHASVSRTELERIISTSSIFWHGTGVNDDEARSPHLMEHFGIATAEAMSAGCVPVVIGKAGPKEVAGEEFARWTWLTWEECARKTAELTALPSLAALAQQARSRAAAFGFDAFRARVHRFVAEEVKR